MFVAPSSLTMSRFEWGEGPSARWKKAAVLPGVVTFHASQKLKAIVEGEAPEERAAA